MEGARKAVLTNGVGLIPSDLAGGQAGEKMRQQQPLGLN